MKAKIKECKKCHKEKPLTEFKKSASNKDGLRNWCVDCSSEYNKQWKTKNKDKVKENAANYYLNNKDKYKDWGKKRRNEHTEEVKEYQKRWRENHKDELKKKKQEYYYKHAEYIKDKVRLWKEENSERLVARKKEYWKNNSHRFIEYKRNYNKTHKKERQVINANRRAWKKGSEGRLTIEQWNTILDRYNHTCLSCKRNDVVLTQDHVIPLSKGGKHTMDNIQPLCVSCNSSKNNKTIDYRKESNDE